MQLAAVCARLGNPVRRQPSPIHDSLLDGLIICRDFLQSNRLIFFMQLFFLVIFYWIKSCMLETSLLAG